MIKSKFIIIILLLTFMSSIRIVNTKTIIFYNTYNCFECMVKLNKSLIKYKEKYPQEEIVVLVRSQQDVLTKKIFKRDIGKMYPKVAVEFEYIEKDDPWPPVNLQGGLFGKYKVTITPTVLIIKESSKRFIPYKELSDYGFQLDLIKLD